MGISPKYQLVPDSVKPKDHNRLTPKSNVELPPRAIAYIICPAMRRLLPKCITFARSVFTDFSINNCSYFSAGIAYWTLFSLFPLALAGMSILGFFYSAPEQQVEIIDRLIELIPVSGGYLADLITGLVGARSGLGLLAIVGLLFSGAKVFASVRRGINHVWGTDAPHSFMLARAIDSIMLLVVVLLVAIILVFGSGVSALLNLIGQAPGVLGIVLKLLQEVLVLFFTLGVFILLYRYIPNTRVTWRDTWLGAIVATLFFHAVRIGFVWFVTNADAFNLVYGSLGALFAVLSWAYFSSLALMWGAQVAATYSRLYGSRASLDGAS